MRFFIARHGETVFNAAGRMQGATAHTPLTRAGFAQAEAMGEALRHRLGARPALKLWASPAGRAQQTLAVICEHLELDWHTAQADERLREIDIGEWSGVFHRDLTAEIGPIVDPAAQLFSVRPPGGEWYDEIAARLQAWLGDLPAESGPHLVVMHGISSRVLRGLLTGQPHRPECRAPVAESLPQEKVAEIADGVETVLPRPGA